MASEAQIDTNARRRCAQCRRQNATRIVREDRQPTSESYKIEHTRDSVFNRLELLVADLDLDDDYDSEYECSVGSRESIILRARLDA